LCWSSSPQFRLVGVQPQLVGDLHELGRRVLAAGEDFDLGVPVLERQRLTGPLDVPDQAGGKGRGEQGSNDVSAPHAVSKVIDWLPASAYD
jgi:hypothetical protein